MLPKAPVERLIKSAGAVRVEAAAVDELVEILEEIGTEVARKAHTLATHAGRRTVEGRDIELGSE